MCGFVLLLGTALLMQSPQSRAETLYKTLDADGRAIYSDRPPTVGKVVKTIDVVSPPSTPLPESVLRYRDELRRSMQQRLAEEATPREARQPALFAAQWCGYCRQAKAYLAGRKIVYEEFDVDTPAGARALAKTAGGRGLPYLVWNGRELQGYTAKAYDDFFRAR